MSNATRDAAAAGDLPDRPPPGLDPRRWSVLERRLAGETLRAIGRDLGVTGQWVRALEGDGLHACRLHVRRVRAEASRAADRRRLALETATLFLGYAVDLIAQGRVHPPPVSRVRYHPGWLMPPAPDSPPVASPASLPEHPPVPIAPPLPYADAVLRVRRLAWLMAHIMERVDVGVSYWANPGAWRIVRDWVAGPDPWDYAAIDRRIDRLVATRDQLRRVL